VEEDILHRFLLTAWECLAAGVLLTLFGVAIGVLFHRVRLLRLACENWVGAAGVGLSAIPGVIRAERADHHHDVVSGGSRPGRSQDYRRLGGDATRAH